MLHLKVAVVSQNLFGRTLVITTVYVENQFEYKENQFESTVDSHREYFF